jgi:phosphoribosylcarboxyaminoimidazole (NCAIR) mutase
MAVRILAVNDDALRKALEAYVRQMARDGERKQASLDAASY